MKKNTVLLSLRQYNKLRSLEIINEMQEEEIDDLKAQIDFCEDLMEETLEKIEQFKENFLNTQNTEKKEPESNEQKPPETNKNSNFEKSIENTAKQIAIDIVNTIEKIAEEQKKKQQENK